MQKILQKLVIDGKEYTLCPVGNRTKMSAQVLARDLRQKGWKARVIGNRRIGWFVYKRK